MTKLVAVLPRLALVAALCLCAGTVSAADPAGRPEPPQFHFTGQPPLPLRAAKIVIEDPSAFSSAGARVDPTYKATPADIARGWARDRIRLVGATGTVTVRILEAGVTEKKLPIKKGLAGLFRDQQDRELDARLKVQIDYVHPAGNGSVIAEASGTRTLGEHMSLNEVEESYYTLLRELANSFDTAMSAEVQARLVGL